MNHAIQLIENQSQLLAPLDILASLQATSHPSVVSGENINAALSEPLRGTDPSYGSVDEGRSATELLSNNATTLTEALDVAANCSSGSVLRWPIFKGRVNPDDITALYFDPEAPQGTTVEGITPETPYSMDRNTNLGRGVREEDVPMLIHDFLSNVHIKNPILDASDLKAMARQISEDGFKWDGASCLVLISCALANLSAPFSLARPQQQDMSQLDARDYSTAETYYTASRKRIGLLDNSVLATQCAFLIGVYEMYSLRPLKAWLSFNHACTTFQAYLHTRARQVSNSRSSRRLEQRLYWSCLKSECEMRDEIELPPTGLAKVEYPDVFPSPPGGTPVPEESGRTVLPGGLEPAFQRSWYYYLSEIACRRIANRIAHALHSVEPHLWLSTPLKRLQRIADELDAQVVQWSEHIPHFLASEDETSPDELTYMLQARFLDLRERIWRPFLYIATYSQPTPPDRTTVMTYAERCLELVLKYIDYTAIKHRHHGSWYGGRQLFTKALLVLAAKKSGNITVPPEWTESVNLVVTCLNYWENEAPDLRAARLALASIYSETGESC